MSFLEKGRYYGYPECCIFAFIESFATRESGKNYISNNRSGFLPCFACAQKVINKEIKIKDLIKNRECETAFPRDNGKRIQEYRKNMMASLLKKQTQANPLTKI